MRFIPGRAECDGAFFFILQYLPEQELRKKDAAPAAVGRGSFLAWGMSFGLKTADLDNPRQNVQKPDNGTGTVH